MERVDILTKMETCRKEIMKYTDELGKLQIELENCDDEDWDWVSVQKASELLSVSVQVIYNKIKKGEIKPRYIESKMLVRKSEIKKIDDRYKEAE